MGWEEKESQRDSSSPCEPRSQRKRPFFLSVCAVPHTRNTIGQQVEREREREKAERGQGERERQRMKRRFQGMKRPASLPCALLRSTACKLRRRVSQCCLC